MPTYLWLEKRKWKINDLKSGLTNLNRMHISIAFRVGGEEYKWQAIFSSTRQRCVEEILGKPIIINDSKKAKILLKVQNNRYRFRQSFEDELAEATPIRFRYKGSILSQLEPSLLGNLVTALKNSIISLRSLDLLSPHMLRQKSRKAEKNDIGMGGEQLSAFIHFLSEEQKSQLLQQLKIYYPQVKAIRTKPLRSGWVQLEVEEAYSDVDHALYAIKTEAKHVNDGMLRLLAI